MESLANVIGGANIIALLFILSFAIDRVVTGTLFILSWASPWQRLVPISALIDDSRNRALAERREKLAYFGLAGILALTVLPLFAQVGVFTAVGVQVPGFLDIIVTGLILMGGSDFLGKLLQMAGNEWVKGAGKAPIEITGKLAIEDESRARLENGRVG